MKEKFATVVLLFCVIGRRNLATHEGDLRSLLLSSVLHHRKKKFATLVDSDATLELVV